MARNGSEEEEEVSALTSASGTVAEAEGSGSEGAEVREDLLGCPTVGHLIGRRRLSAAVDRLEQEIQFLQEELAEMERGLGPPSAACGEVVAGVGRIPDGLLPVTRGPGDVAWERWFRSVRGSECESSRDGGGGRGVHGHGGGRRWWMRGRRCLPSLSGSNRVEAK